MFVPSFFAQLRQLYLDFIPVVQFIPPAQYQVVYYEAAFCSETTEAADIQHNLNELIQDSDTHRLFLEWVNNRIQCRLAKPRPYKVALNMPTHQLIKPENLDFLRSLSPYGKQLVLELHHTPQLLAKQDYPRLLAQLTQLREWGYTLILEGLETNFHNLDEITQYLPYLHGLKWPYTKFVSLDQHVHEQFIKAWQKLAADYHLIFILDKVADQQLSQHYLKQGLLVQQDPQVASELIEGSH